MQLIVDYVPTIAQYIMAFPCPRCRVRQNEPCIMKRVIKRHAGDMAAHAPRIDRGLARRLHDLGRAPNSQEPNTCYCSLRPCPRRMH